MRHMLGIDLSSVFSWILDLPQVLLISFGSLKDERLCECIEVIALIVVRLLLFWRGALLLQLLAN